MPRGVARVNIRWRPGVKYLLPAVQAEDALITKERVGGGVSSLAYSIKCHCRALQSEKFPYPNISTRHSCSSIHYL